MVEGVRVLQWCSGNANVCAQLFRNTPNGYNMPDTNRSFPFLVKGESGR
jgi:hypothetical protein